MHIASVYVKQKTKIHWNAIATRGRNVRRWLIGTCRWKMER